MNARTKYIIFVAGNHDVCSQPSLFHLNAKINRLSERGNRSTADGRWLGRSALRRESEKEEKGEGRKKKCIK